MLKQLVLLIVLSLLAIIFLTQVHQILHLLTAAYHYITNDLARALPGGTIGRIIRETLALVIIPLVIGLLIDLIYWAVRRRHLPFLMIIIWGLWLLLIALLR